MRKLCIIFLVVIGLACSSCTGNWERNFYNMGIDVDDGAGNQNDGLIDEQLTADSIIYGVGELSEGETLETLDADGDLQDTSDVGVISESVITVESLSQMPAESVLETAVLDSIATEQLFFASEISDEIFARINGISFQENDVIPISDLRYLRVLHMGFDGETRIGELIVNEEIAREVLEIFGMLYNKGYPIEKMLLVDEYGGDDEASMADNNTSAFNYRLVSGTTRLSKHGMGMAIDLNPLYNPYIRTDGNGHTLVEPANATPFVDRSADAVHQINENDLAYRYFTKLGFTWGGDWNSVKDYQHFEK